MHTSTKWLIGEIAVIGIATTLLSITGYPLLMPYPWHLFFHVLGAVLFMGNIVVTAMWMVMAEQSRNDAALRYAARMVNWADVAFTAPGIFLLLTNGFILAYTAWGGLTASWIAAALGLFSLSGLTWAVFLIPLQNRLLRYAGSDDEALPSQFFRTLRQWYFWGVIATLLPILSLILMAVKPKLW
jgi:uncharacterized membrane protein